MLMTSVNKLRGQAVLEDETRVLYKENRKRTVNVCHAAAAFVSCLFIIHS